MTNTLYYFKVDVGENSGLKKGIGTKKGSKKKK